MRNRYAKLENVFITTPLVNWMAAFQRYRNHPESSAYFEVVEPAPNETQEGDYTRHLQTFAMFSPATGPHLFRWAIYQNEVRYHPPLILTSYEKDHPFIEPGCLAVIISSDLKGFTGMASTPRLEKVLKCLLLSSSIDAINIAISCLMGLTYNKDRKTFDFTPVSFTENLSTVKTEVVRRCIPYEAFMYQLPFGQNFEGYRLPAMIWEGWTQYEYQMKNIRSMILNADHTGLYYHDPVVQTEPSTNLSGFFSSVKFHYNIFTESEDKSRGVVHCRSTVQLASACAEKEADRIRFRHLFDQLFNFDGIYTFHEMQKALKEITNDNHRDLQFLLPEVYGE